MPDGHGSVDSCFRRNDDLRKTTTLSRPVGSTGTDAQYSTLVLSTQYLYSTYHLEELRLIDHCNAQSPGFVELEPASSPASTKSVF